MAGPRITLEQWRTLVAVVEAGGYAKAAERLHKSQSTLTYAIQKLEALLGVATFAIEGRKAVLTPAGQVLYRRGKTLLEEAEKLEHAAASLAAGWEPEIRIAVEIVFPTWLLLDCFAQFGAEHPDIRLELYETVLGGTDEALTERRVDLAIAATVPPGFAGDPLMPLRFVAAAAPSHPLHRLGRAVTREDLRAHRHLVIRDSGTQRAQRGNWINERRWTVSHKATSIHAATLGLGYAWFGEDMIRRELDTGALRPLPLREGGERWAEVYLIHADPDAARPGARRLAEIVRARVAALCAAPQRARRSAPATPGKGRAAQRRRR
jgi:DNA-binding transcriptional LysR family regulator